MLVSSATVNLRSSRGTPLCDTVCLPNKLCPHTKGVPDEQFTTTSPTHARVGAHRSESDPAPTCELGPTVSSPRLQSELPSRHARLGTALARPSRKFNSTFAPHLEKQTIALRRLLPTSGAPSLST